MYIVDVIELVLQRLSLTTETAHDFVLVVRLADGDMVVPPDRTVESLGEQHVLELVPRSDVGPAGLRRFRTRDEQPNAAGTGTRQIFASRPAAAGYSARLLCTDAANTGCHRYSSGTREGNQSDTDRRFGRLVRTLYGSPQSPALARRSARSRDRHRRRLVSILSCSRGPGESWRRPVFGALFPAPLWRPFSHFQALLHAAKLPTTAR